MYALRGTVVFFTSKVVATQQAHSAKRPDSQIQIQLMLLLPLKRNKALHAAVEGGGDCRASAQQGADERTAGGRCLNLSCGFYARALPTRHRDGGVEEENRAVDDTSVVVRNLLDQGAQAL
ncbi:hypothetical protein L1887_62303 [Cichorium endivia]|nr:hypothetical protein L1887_62303 [Cichorium endivia]